MTNRPKSRLAVGDGHLAAGSVQHRMTASRIFPMPHILLGLIFGLFVLLSGVGPSHAQSQPIRPVGVVVHVDLEEAIQQCKSQYKKMHNGKEPSKSDVQSCLSDLFVSLLSPSYISGIALGVHWDRIQLQSMEAFCQQYTCPSGHSCPSDIKCLSGAIIPIAVVVANSDFFDWSYILSAFGVANGAGKNVLLKLTPGVQSPKWLTNPSTGQIASCDTPVFEGGKADPGCGTQTFHKIPEQIRADTEIQPLPWNVTYQSAWANFLYQLKHAIADQFPLIFVGIDLAGPNCASDEMILPTSAYGSYVKSNSPKGKTDADDAWTMLIANTYQKKDPTLLNSDQVFINSWYTFIVTYEEIFQNLTLVISPDDETSMPEIGPPTVHGDNFLYSTDDLCSKTASKFAVSCETKTEVLSNFLDYPTANQPNATKGGNLKAALIGGLITASNPDNGEIGLPAVKLMAQKYGIWGGAQFDHPVSNPEFTQEEGCPLGQVCKCPKSDPNCSFVTVTVGQAMLGVLGNFFDGTQYGGIQWPWGGTMGQQRLQYLMVEYEDIEYALDPRNQYATDFQNYLCAASIALYKMAGQTPRTCIQSGP
jgi:hypothetical protein